MTKKTLLPSRIADEINSPLAVVDFEPMWVEYYGADETFFAGADQNLGENSLAEPFQLNVVALERPCLTGCKGGLDRAGGRGPRSVEQLFTHHQGAGKSRIDLKVQRTLANVECEKRLVKFVKIPVQDSCPRF